MNLSIIIPDAVLYWAHKVLSCPNSEYRLFLILNIKPSIFPSLMQELEQDCIGSLEISVNHFLRYEVIPLARQRSWSGSSRLGSRWLLHPAVHRHGDVLTSQPDPVKESFEKSKWSFLICTTASFFFSFFSERDKPQGNTIPVHSAVAGLLSPSLVGMGYPRSRSGCAARGSISLRKLYFWGHDIYSWWKASHFFAIFGLNMHKAP